VTADQRPHEIDVVNHQIEHDGHVRAARVERREPVALDEPSFLDMRKRRANRTIEPLHVPRLDERARFRGDREQFIGLGQRCRDRLLDQ
jgi:hypothetical protein